MAKVEVGLDKHYTAYKGDIKITFVITSDKYAKPGACVENLRSCNAVTFKESEMDDLCELWHAMKESVRAVK